MAEIENNDEKREQQQVYSKAVRAGKRTYFLDVRTTRSNDYYLTITESRKRHHDGAFVKRKIFLYKEDFHKFINALTETINYMKTELMPDYDFDKFSHEKRTEDTIDAEKTKTDSNHKFEQVESTVLIEDAETLDSEMSFKKKS